MFEVFIKTALQLKNSIIAIMAIVAMATVMDLSGIISTLAQSIVDLTGRSYVFLAPVIGALGTFVTGATLTRIFCLASYKLLQPVNYISTLTG